MKNIFKRVKNNLEYAKWRKIRDEAASNAVLHADDEDDTEFKFWKAKFDLALKKCNEIDIY